jgi:hypothetical protein
LSGVVESAAVMLKHNLRDFVRLGGIRRRYAEA